MSRNLFRFVPLVAEALFAASATLSSAAITRTPYIQDVQKTSAVVMWESDQPAPGVVHFGPDEKMAREAKAADVPLPPAGTGAAIVNGTLAGPHVYEAILEGLAPGSKVFYQVEDGGSKSEPKQFKTTPETADKFRFVAYGDCRTQPKVHAAVAEQIRLANPDFIIHTGDLVSNGASYGSWTREFFAPLEKVMDHTPFWPCIGNHERDGLNYLALFHLPDKESPYSFDHGSAHFAALDCVRFQPDAMAKWLDEDLSKSHAKWKFVFYHFPTYNAGGHNSRWGRRILTEVFRKHHVDIVFTGHSHLYERTKPIMSSYDESKWPVLYIVTGGGGAPLYELAPADYIAAAKKAYHDVVVDIDGDKLSLAVVDEKGEKFDSYVIDKTGGHKPDYIASALSEELTDFTDEVGHSLAQRVPDAKAGEPFSVAFKVANPAVRGQAKLTLAPQLNGFIGSVEPKSIDLALEPGAEREAVFKFTPALNLKKDDPAFVEKINAALKAAGNPKKPVLPLLKLNVEYQTAIGSGHFTAPTLEFGLGPGFKVPE